MLVGFPSLLPFVFLMVADRDRSVKATLDANAGAEIRLLNAFSGRCEALQQTAGVLIGCPDQRWNAFRQFLLFLTQVVRAGGAPWPVDCRERMKWCQSGCVGFLLLCAILAPAYQRSC
jgi:hypothetical protein